MNKTTLSSQSEKVDFIQKIQESSDRYEVLSFSERNDLILAFKSTHPELKATRTALIGFMTLEYCNG